MSKKQRQSSFSEQFGGEAKEDSSLTLPLTIIGVTLLLSAGFLYYYFGPSIDELTGNALDPTASQELVDVSIGGHPFRIPTNYTQFPKDRRPGAKTRVELFALLPDFEPYSPSRQEIFESNSPESPVIYFQIAENTSALNEQNRFDRVYADHIFNLDGEPGPFELTRFEFDGSPGYDGQELFAASGEDAKAKYIKCHTTSDTVPRPHCRRDLEISEEISVSYRYKRPWLKDWKEIDAQVLNLVNSWSQASLTAAPEAEESSDDESLNEESLDEESLDDEDVPVSDDPEDP